MSPHTDTTPAEFAQALAARRKQQARRRLIGWGIAAGAIVLVLVLAWLLFWSPVFAVRNVTVNGTSLLTAEQVLDQARVPMEEPLLTTDTTAITARVDELPEVESVKVSRDFPSTLVLDVTERKLIYLVDVEGRYRWVDGDGVAFRMTDAPVEGTVLAVITGVDQERLYADVATVAKHLPEALLPRVQRIRATAVDDITIELADNARVVWGSAEQSALKSQVLATLLSVEATTYDVSAPSHPTTK